MTEIAILAAGAMVGIVVGIFGGIFMEQLRIKSLAVSLEDGEVLNIRGQLLQKFIPNTEETI
jgi:hypothetical protein